MGIAIRKTIVNTPFFSLSKLYSSHVNVSEAVFLCLKAFQLMLRYMLVKALPYGFLL